MNLQAGNSLHHSKTSAKSSRTSYLSEKNNSNRSKLRKLVEVTRLLFLKPASSRKSFTSTRMICTKIWSLVKTSLAGWFLRAKRFVNSLNLDRATHHAVRDLDRHTILTQIKIANKTRTKGWNKAQRSFTERREASRLVSTALSPYRLTRILRLNQMNLSSISETL